MIEIKRGGAPTRDGKLVLYFSGKQGNYKTDHFHFMGQAYNAGFESWFIRDTSDRWYNTENYQEVRAHLKLTCSLHRRVVFVGSSMGGYGALKFALDIKPSKVLAFVPQVSTEFSSIDLPDLYEQAHERPEIDIHIGKTAGDTLWDDAGSAKRMAKFAKIIVHDYKAHNVAELLKNDGKIQELIINA